MNFLAHLTLSRCSADLQLGNYLGDFVRGRELATLQTGVQRGVLMHRAIDRATDTDPDVRALNSLLTGRHGRYAPVVSDIAFDYYLSRNWNNLVGIDFNDFCRNTYQRLLGGAADMPMRHRELLIRMAADDWLAHYGSRVGMDLVFRRFRRRLSRPELLDGIGDTLTDLDAVFNRTLLRLFPRLQALADPYCEESPSP